MRKRATARGRGCAACELRVERALRVARGRVVDPHTGKRAAVENHASHRSRIAPEKDLRERRAVGGAVDVDLPVAERAPDALEVGGGDARRVQPRIAVQACEAAAEVRGHRRRVARRHLLVGAREPAGAAAAALVDDHEVAVAPDFREEPVDANRRIGRRAARPALEVEERARRRPPRRRHDDNVKRDRASLRPERILRNGQLCAPRPRELAVVVARRRSAGRRSADATAPASPSPATTRRRARR